MNQDQTPMSGQVPTIANVLLVHGAWADGSSWAGVNPLLRERGHSVLAVQLALNSLADDVAHVRQVLADRLQGLTVLVGHSYGGAVISGAATGQANAIALVYASAFAPDAGESLGELSGGIRQPRWETTCSRTLAASYGSTPPSTTRCFARTWMRCRRS